MTYSVEARQKDYVTTNEDGEKQRQQKREKKLGHWDEN